MFLRLKDNISMNNINNIFAHQLAIGNKSGFVKFKEERNTWTSKIIESSNDDGCIVILL